MSQLKNEKQVDDHRESDGNFPSIVGAIPCGRPGSVAHHHCDRLLIEVAMTPTRTSLDKNLSHLKHFLESAAHRSPSHRDDLTTANLTIDLAVLGLTDPMQAMPKSWTDGYIYPIRLYHATVLIGPLYHPASGRGPCPHCLERRWFTLRSSVEQFALQGPGQPLVSGPSPYLTTFVLEAIWSVIEMALICSLPIATTPDDKVYVLRCDTLHLSCYQLIADSLCPICSTRQPDTPEAAQMSLASHIKETLSSYHLVQPLGYNLPMPGYLNPVCGMLGSTVIFDYTHTITSPVSGKFMLKGYDGSFDVWWGGHANSYDLSLRLGILEGLERYSSHRVRSKFISAVDSYHHLSPDALDPRACGLYQPEFYRRNAAHFQPFDPACVMPWVWGYSLHNAQPLLVPEQLVYYMPNDADFIPFVQECSSGCATGSTLEEALLFGLLELIERDAFLLSWYAKLSPCKIDPWSCHDRTTLHMLDRIDRLGYDVHLLDTRTDIRVPSITAVAILRQDDLGKLMVAANASLDPKDAIHGALCEIAANIPGFAPRLKSNLKHVLAMASDHTKVASIDDHGQLFGLPEMAVQASFLTQNPVVISLDEAYAEWTQQCPSSLDLLDDLRACLAQILDLGMDVIVVDQTSPEQERAGLKTACVIVPGLLPIDFGWGRERVLDLPRLRTAPRAAGYLTADFDPIHCNLLPHPFS